MSNYSQGKNWSSNGGSFQNGRVRVKVVAVTRLLPTCICSSSWQGETIRNPEAYFNSVASNSHGYNQTYTNGHGKEIGEAGRSAYYATVAADKYGYNGIRK